MKLITVLLFVAVFGVQPIELHAAELPRVVILAQNEGTEITDLLVPYAILSDAGVNVEIAATESGAVSLWPAYELLGLDTLSEVEPKTIDLLVVPAVLNPKDPALLEFVRTYHQTGGLIASICDGVYVLAEAGLLDNLRATGHFYSHRDRGKSFPAVNWVRGHRYIQDGRVISTAGVSASAPAAIYFLEVLLGKEQAETTAKNFGIDPSPDHNAHKFSFGIVDGYTMVSNIAFGIAKRNYVVLGETGIDEFSLAFMADMLGRTSRVRLGIDHPSGIVTLKNGLKLSGPLLTESQSPVLLPGSDAVLGDEGTAALRVDAPASAVRQVSAHVTSVFGDRTAKFVAKQLELPPTENN